MSSRGDQSGRARLQIDDQADPAPEPLLLTLEIVLASRKPNQPGAPKRMPGKNGVAVKRGTVPTVHRFDRLRTTELEVLNAIDCVCANFAPELERHRPICRPGHTVVDLAQQNQVGKSQERMSV